MTKSKLLIFVKDYLFLKLFNVKVSIKILNYYFVFINIKKYI